MFLIFGGCLWLLLGTLRSTIELKSNVSLYFKSIAKGLNRDCTYIAKEIKKHITFKKVGYFGRDFNNCTHRFDCKHSYICDNDHIATADFVLNATQFAMIMLWSLALYF